MSHHRSLCPVKLAIALSSLALLAPVVSSAQTIDPVNDPSFPKGSATSPLTFASSNQALVTGFNFAKQHALIYVQTGLYSSDHPSVPNIACYWAGSLSRRAFYLRDASHQFIGAHFLGLDAENLSMAKAFAASQTAARAYWPLWSIGFDGSVYDNTIVSGDYFGDAYFYRELPGPFDLLRRAYTQYLFTGDANWIQDPTLVQYYATTTSTFLRDDHQDANGVVAVYPNSLPLPTPIPSRVGNVGQTGNPYNPGQATYNEQGTDNFVEAGDAIGCQYAAFAAYSEIQRARGDWRGAYTSATAAEQLKNFFNLHWYSTAANSYIRGFRLDGSFMTDFGKENSFFMPATLITAPGPRTTSYLQFIDTQMADPSVNGEAQTYLPEIYYEWGQPDTAEKWLVKIITNPGSTTTPGDLFYPEFSYTFIGSLFNGLLGVQPDAPANLLITTYNLPSDTQWAEGDHIPLGKHDLYVREDRSNNVLKTTVRNNPVGSDQTDPVSGALFWQAGFRGSHPWLLVNGCPRPTHPQLVNGVEIQTVEVSVPLGSTVTVETPVN